jgi:hypothetical protein
MDDDSEGFMPFISSDDPAISNVRDTNCCQPDSGARYLIEHFLDAFAQGIVVDVGDCCRGEMGV